jgi:hypothetical protein
LGPAIFVPSTFDAWYSGGVSVEDDVIAEMTNAAAMANFMSWTP